MKDMSNIVDKISMFLVCSYCYYILGRSIINDSEFDELCNLLLYDFDSLENSEHPHKSLITKERLQTTSGFDITSWPRIVGHTSRMVLRYHDGIATEKDLFIDNNDGVNKFYKTHKYL